MFVMIDVFLGFLFGLGLACIGIERLAGLPEKSMREHLCTVLPFLLSFMASPMSSIGVAFSWTGFGVSIMVLGWAWAGIGKKDKMDTDIGGR